MSLLDVIASGLYTGRGDGTESGSFVARLEVQRLPNAGLSFDYEAASYDEGVQHREHALLTAAPDGRLRLHTAHSESPFLTELVETAPGSGRFEQPVPFGPYVLAVVIEAPSPGSLTYAWWWAEAGGTPTEQSRATVSLTM